MNISDALRIIFVNLSATFPPPGMTYIGSDDTVEGLIDSFDVLSF